MAAGPLSISRSLERKGTGQNPGTRAIKGTGRSEEEVADSVDRYYGSFSLESKRHVWDLLDKHPKFGRKGNSRLGQIDNNTREVLPNDPIKTIQNGGKITYE